VYVTVLGSALAAALVLVVHAGEKSLPPPPTAHILSVQMR
jgi:hypothetical protein